MKIFWDLVYHLCPELTDTIKCPGCNYPAGTFVTRAENKEEATKIIKNYIKAYIENREDSYSETPPLCPDCFIEAVGEKTTEHEKVVK